jgi:hypothetical protein
MRKPRFTHPLAGITAVKGSAPISLIGGLNMVSEVCKHDWVKHTGFSLFIGCFIGAVLYFGLVLSF